MFACMVSTTSKSAVFNMFVFIHVYVFPFTFHSIASGLLFSEMSRVDVEVTAKWPLVCALNKLLTRERNVR